MTPFWKSVRELAAMRGNIDDDRRKMQGMPSLYNTKFVAIPADDLDRPETLTTYSVLHISEGPALAEARDKATVEKPYSVCKVVEIAWVTGS